ncbi:hypothetical protein IAT38_005335 [Cryptococcus sp. DSM 104549]
MADKGTAAAADSGSDTDSSTDFFISKRKPILRAPSIPPPPRESSPVYIHDSDDSDYSGSEQKKRRRVTKKKEAPVLPEWTRQAADKRERKGSSRVRGSTELRGSTEERFASSALGSDDEGRKTQGKKGRKRVELTPPPLLSSKKLEDLDNLIQSMYAENPDGDDDDDDIEIQPKSDKDKVLDTCSIVVRMEMDPTKKEKAPPVAVKHYTKARTVTINRTDTLFKVMESIGGNLNKAPDDIILVYEGERCYSRQTPADLRIRTDATAEMVGYEKYHYDIIEAERRARLEKLDDDDDVPAPDDDDNAPASPSGAAREVSATPAPENGETILIHVRGSNGEARLRVRKTVTAGKVLKHYCTKVGLSKDDVEKLQLVFDGSGVDPEDKVGDLDVEDGDMLDVRSR